MRDNPTLPFTIPSQDGHRKAEQTDPAQARIPQNASTSSRGRKYPPKDVKMP
jgi:hypothetical protein